MDMNDCIVQKINARIPNEKLVLSLITVKSCLFVGMKFCGFKKDIWWTGEFENV